MNRQAACHRGGMTLIELSTYIALLVTVGAPIASAVLSSVRSTTENDTVNRVAERNRTAIFRLERAVRRGLSGSLAVTDGGLTLALTPAAGFDGTNVVAGTPVQYQFQITAGEEANGRDDNGNGLADEGELVLVDTGTGTRDRIVGGVDLNSSGFVLNGGGVTVTVASIGSLGRDDETHSVVSSSTIYPRN